MTMTLPTLFIPHGGGPCFFMDPAGGPPDPMWQPMQAYLAGLIASLPERPRAILRSEEHTSELKTLMRSSYALFCLKKKKQSTIKVKIRSFTTNTVDQRNDHKTPTT